jgi:hypothetical protein
MYTDLWNIIYENLAWIYGSNKSRNLYITIHTVALKITEITTHVQHYFSSGNSLHPNYFWTFEIIVRVTALMVSYYGL